MSKVQCEKIAEMLQEAQREIEALPESANNGLLIDAASHVQNASEHLSRYCQMCGVEK